MKLSVPDPVDMTAWAFCSLITALCVACSITVLRWAVHP